MSHPRPGPLDGQELERFLRTFLYGEKVFFVDEIVDADADRGEIVARLDTRRTWPLGGHQRLYPGHPPHVSGAELIMVTADLGCLHAWFFHDVRWDEGWVGFGNRIRRAEFRNLAGIGPPVDLLSKEIRSRRAADRLTLRFEFEFRQEGRVVYVADQTATFLRTEAPP